MDQFRPNLINLLKKYSCRQALPGAGNQLAPRLLVAFGEIAGAHFDNSVCECQFWRRPFYRTPGQQKLGTLELQLLDIPTSNRLLNGPVKRSASPSRPWHHEQQRERGKTQPRALEIKWIRILSRCWQERRSYDEAKYLLALKAKGSPLVAELAK